MKSGLLAAAFVLGFVTYVHAAEEESPWIKDYPQARAAAAKSGKPIFLVFRCER